MNKTLNALGAWKKRFGEESGATAAFTGSGLPLKALVVDIDCVQSGSGDPSAANIRPISGRTGATVSLGGGSDPAETLALSWQTEAGTVYGGTLDAVSGVLTADKAYLAVDGTEDWVATTNNTYFFMGLGALGLAVEDDAICSHAVDRPDITGSNNVVGFRVYDRTSGSNKGCTLLMRFDGTKQQTLEEFKAYLAAQAAASTPVQVAYTLTQPLCFSLTPQGVPTRRGENVISADTGDVCAVYRLPEDLLRSRLALLLRSRPRGKEAWI